MNKSRKSGLGHALNRLAQRIRGAALTRELAARLGAFYLRLVWLTSRWTIEGQEHRDDILMHPAGFIISTWHGRLFILPCLKPRSRQVHAMISDNQDGEIIARLVSFHNVHAVRGSTTDPRKRHKAKGGGEAFRESLPLLRDGHIVAITPDGPRGPRMRAQHGVSAISAIAGASVLPIGISSTRGKMLRNWDRFLIPYPFGRGAVVYGVPLPAPPANDPDAVEAHRLAIEAATTAATRRADEICSRETPEPANEIRA
jgi:lysophospholipid acyltransferase (LPLAT)-like uncharacterized protein